MRFTVSYLYNNYPNKYIGLINFDNKIQTGEIYFICDTEDESNLYMRTALLSGLSVKLIQTPPDFIPEDMVMYVLYAQSIVP